MKLPKILIKYKRISYFIILIAYNTVSSSQPHKNIVHNDNISISAVKIIYYVYIYMLLCFENGFAGYMTVVVAFL